MSRLCGLVFQIIALVSLLIGTIAAFYLKLVDINVAAPIVTSLSIPICMMTENIIGKKETTVVWVQAVPFFLSFFAAAILEQLMTTGVVARDAANLWLEIGKSAAILFMFPVYFTVVRPPTTRHLPVYSK
ncbi:hypothetical protein PFISCL1PPCAC_22234, partial [Pristionchus fissidentatus]